MAKSIRHPTTSARAGLSMADSQKRGHLSPTERSEIIRLYTAGGVTYRELGERFGCSRSTVYRVIQQKNTINIPPEQRQSEQSKRKQSSSSETTSDESSVQLIDDPIEFRRSKLIEIAGDIMSTRTRGSVQVLPALHRLHIQTHDELTQMKREIDDFDDVENPDDLIQTIAVAVAGLPPVLRDRLNDMLDVDMTNVIPLRVNRGNE